jgi:hypothetical protein
MPKIEKSARREAARRKSRYGMTVVGNSTRRVMRALAAREQRPKDTCCCDSAGCKPCGL